MLGRGNTRKAREREAPAEQLLAMPTDQLAVRLRRKATQFLGKADYLKDARYRGKYEPNPRYAVQELLRTGKPSGRPRR